MDNKRIAGLLAIGLVVGAGAVFPIARASQPVKTVTKTVTKTQAVKIQNGESLQQVLASVGNPAAETRKPTAQDNYVECVAWTSARTSTTPTRGSWELSLCVKTQ